MGLPDKYREKVRTYTNVNHIKKKLHKRRLFTDTVYTGYKGEKWFYNRHVSDKVPCNSKDMW